MLYHIMINGQYLARRYEQSKHGYMRECGWTLGSYIQRELFSEWDIDHRLRAINEIGLEGIAVEDREYYQAA